MAEGPLDLVEVAEPEKPQQPFTPPSSPTRNGRPPGGVAVGGTRQPFLIGVAGGTASGKTSVCHKIMEQLELADSSKKRVVVISQDSFYRKLEPREMKIVNQGEFNFDHPGNRPLPSHH